MCSLLLFKGQRQQKWDLVAGKLLHHTYKPCWHEYPSVMEKCEGLEGVFCYTRDLSVWASPDDHGCAATQRSMPLSAPHSLVRIEAAPDVHAEDMLHRRDLPRLARTRPLSDGRNDPHFSDERRLKAR